MSCILVEHRGSAQKPITHALSIKSIQPMKSMPFAHQLIGLLAGIGKNLDNMDIMDYMDRERIHGIVTKSFTITNEPDHPRKHRCNNKTPP